MDILENSELSGILQTDDGHVPANLELTFGLGVVNGTLMVPGDPTFGQRNFGKRFVFVPAGDAKHDFSIDIVNEDGACCAGPIHEPVAG